MNMFDFEKFRVYASAESLYKKLFNNVYILISDKNLLEQIRRASSSILLNIAEGSGKRSRRDKRNYYVFARGSLYECVAILRILKIEGIITNNCFDELYKDISGIDNMLSGLIRSMMETEYNQKLDYKKSGRSLGY